MLWIKSFIFYAFLTLCKVQAEMTEAAMTQLSDTLQSVKNEIRTEKDTNVLDDATNYSSTSNDVEVFKEKLGPQKEKQEEEPEAEAEEEAQPEAEEPKEEEADAEGEPAAQPEVEEEPEAEAAPEEEPKAEAAPDEKPEAEAAPNDEPATEPTPEEPDKEEPEADKELEKEPEAETAVEPITDVPNKETDESEMPQDEPAKETETNKQDESEVSEVEKDTKKIVITKAMEKNQVSCFSCTSNEDSKCSIKPIQLTPCPKVNESDAGKHNGCYTLYQVPSNITMRGCVDELAEEGLKYCLTNDKLCSLCYSNGCNNKMAPSHSTKLQFNVYSLVILSIFSLIIKDFACLTFIKL